MQNAFRHPPLLIHCASGLLKFSPIVAYENPYFNLNYSKASAARTVRFPALLEPNAVCYMVGKHPSAVLHLRTERRLNVRHAAKIKIFSATVHTI